MLNCLTALDEPLPYTLVGQQEEEEEEIQASSDSGGGGAGDSGGYSGRAEGDIDQPTSGSGAGDGGQGDGWHHGGGYGGEDDWGSEEYEGEGWGLTYDGNSLIMSDGTSTLHFLDPQSFEEVGRTQVRDRDCPVVRLNELEYVEGEIYANVWQTECIARIDPLTGQVIGWIDLGGLREIVARRWPGPVDALNGIAYDAEGGRLFVTGKLWPLLFQIEFPSR